MDKYFRLPISKDLKKFIPLPRANEFEVHPLDLLVSSNLRSFIKTKGFVFDNTSVVAERQTALTRQGYILLWMNYLNGFVLDVRSAKSVSVVTERYKDNGIYLLGCIIKIKFSFGSVNILLENEKIGKWRRSLQEVFDGFIMEEKKIEEAPPTSIQEEFMPSKKSDSMVTCCGDLQEFSADENDSLALRSETEISTGEIKSTITNEHSKENSSQTTRSKENIRGERTKQSSISDLRGILYPAGRCASAPAAFKRSQNGSEGTKKEAYETNMDKSGTPRFSLATYSGNKASGF